MPWTLRKQFWWRLPVNFIKKLVFFSSNSQNCYKKKHSFPKKVRETKSSFAHDACSSVNTSESSFPQSESLSPKIWSLFKHKTFVKNLSNAQSWAVNKQNEVFTSLPRFCARSFKKSRSKTVTKCWNRIFVPKFYHSSKSGCENLQGSFDNTVEFFCPKSKKNNENWFFFKKYTLHLSFAVNTWETVLTETPSKFNQKVDVF